jgi:hypothetical protein
MRVRSRRVAKTSESHEPAKSYLGTTTKSSAGVEPIRITHIALILGR